MDMTARFGLPLLAVAQAAKEMTINEAMTAIDAAIQPVVESETATPPSSPDLGQSWLVADGAGGAFAGHDGAIAAWTAGGWRFVTPFEGTMAWRRDTEVIVRRHASAWQNGTPIATPTTGSVIDAEARAAIIAILSQMRSHGLIAA